MFHPKHSILCLTHPHFSSNHISESEEEEEDDGIIVYVGNEQTPFTLSKKQLEPILSHMELEGYKYHHLPDVNKKTFRIFERWLRKKTLDKLDPDVDDKAKERMLEYLELYFKATEWEIYDLANDIMDRFRERYQCEDGYFPAFLIKKIYDNTQPGAPLRRYIVDNFLFKSEAWPPDYVQDWFDHHAEKGNTDFLLDCYQAALALAKDNILDPSFHNRDCKCEDPVHFDCDFECEYHVHQEDEECGSQRARKRRRIG